MWNKIVTFGKEVRAEGSKVTWPSRQELIGSTVVTVVTTVIVSLFIALVDQGLTIGFTAIFTR